MREDIDAMPEYCSIEVAMTVLGGKWKLAILRHLFAGVQRFGVLRREMPTITPRMLTRQLRELESDGLIVRTVYAEVPPKVEYSLTDLGRSLEDVVDRLEAWGAWYRDGRRASAAPQQS